VNEAQKLLIFCFKLSGEDITWVPLLSAMSLSLNEEKKEDIEGLISEQMQGLESQLDTLKEKVEQIGKNKKGFIFYC